MNALLLPAQAVGTRLVSAVALFGPPGPRGRTVFAGFGGLVVGVIVPLAIVALIVYAIVAFVRSRRPRADGHGWAPPPGSGGRGWGGGPTNWPPGSPNSPAERILEERLACGDITVDEYEARLGALARGRANQGPLANTVSGPPGTEDHEPRDDRTERLPPSYPWR
ncbi:MAG: hypothetical protein M3Y36_02230 [Actinomycetota bacterium]|nr:hypothetical protein [Actinomycetota bacterium]